MLTKIAGIIWIILGLWLLWRPQAVTKRIQKKGRKAFTKLLLVIGLSVIGALISFAFEYSGWIPKLIAVAGIVVVIKLFFAARKKFGEHLAERTKQLTQMHLRIVAVGYLVLGVGFLFAGRITAALGIGQTKTEQVEETKPEETDNDEPEQPEKKNNDENDRLPRTLRHR